MPRGIRADTPERIALARQQKPLSLGPILGELATHYNLSAGTIASFVGAHEQTALRWFFGRSHMQPSWLKSTMKLLAVLSWMYTENKQPLVGNSKEKTAQFAAYIKEFNELAKT